MNELFVLFRENTRLDAGERLALSVFGRFLKRRARPAAAGLSGFGLTGGEVGFGLTPAALDVPLFYCFLTDYLPQSLCRAEEGAIDALYPVLERFCRFCDACGAPQPWQAFQSLPVGLLDEFARPLRAKAALLRLIESPLLRREPIVVDLPAYAKKRQQSRKSRREEERGLYQVADVFGRDSVVLRRLLRESGPETRSGYVRLYLNQEVVSALRPQDTLRLTLRARGLLSGWLVEDVDACYAGASGPVNRLLPS